MRVFDPLSWDMFHQFAVNFGFWIAAGGVAADHGITGQVEDGGEQTWSQELTVSLITNMAATSVEPGHFTPSTNHRCGAEGPF